MKTNYVYYKDAAPSIKIDPRHSLHTTIFN